MIHTFIDSKAVVEIPNEDIECVLAGAMKKCFGYRTPTRYYSTWLARFEGLNYNAYQTILLELVKLGYGRILKNK
ncbi:hypothetical protein GPZ88_10170 (plasmid) [Streptococcus ruminicola]|uniref:Uncharacterized protein n=1 Tax=Streptococcus ruminicola TaxID=2686210 RepID=A0A6G8I329_9STRE|nr:MULTISPECIES: hypothetical protein [Streptococcus]QGX47383.1 hypothetical protein GPA00_09625 [Streptococcus equinus]QIM47431.1 hypothetical protein GPZ88_10170 [Streptococcus ruminicola]